VNVLLNDIK
jgi:flagellar motor switch protein FliG